MRSPGCLSITVDFILKARVLFFFRLSVALYFPLSCSHNCLSQTQSSGPTPSSPFRLNPGDVQLASTNSTVNNPTASGETSPSSWESLTGSTNDPMAQSNVGQRIAATNSTSSVVSKVHDKPFNTKTDYGPQVGWGLRSSFGLALQQSISTTTANGNLYQSVYFNPGARFDLEAFYNVTNGFYFGMESGLIYNSLSNTYPLFSDAQKIGNGAFYQVPVLINLRFQIPNRGPIRGYCTGGVGGVWDYLTTSVTMPGQQSLTYSQHQWNYAFQLGFGVQYNLMPGLDLDTSFKTFITPNPLLFSDGTSQVKASYNYALEIGLVYRF